ncbi:hypothetical protein HG531_002485 [Fusarium graminearum]|nr:hypothetical protein HG531_002485 [Fusarium graminearum]
MCLGRNADGLGCRCGGLLGAVYLHSITVGLALAFTLFLLLEIILTFAFDVDTAIVRQLVLVSGVLSLVLDASHFCVFPAGGLALRLGLLFGLLSSLFVSFLGTVFVAIGDKVSLGLLRRVLGGGRSLGVPEATLDGGLSVELLGVIFIVDVVTNANEFTSIVGTCQENDGDTKDFGIRDAGDVGSVGLENEFVDSDRDRTDEKGVEFLVVLIAERC